MHIGGTSMIDALSEIHVALSMYDPTGSYARHIGVLSTSILCNTKRKICIHILHDSTLTDTNRIKLIQIAKIFNQKIDLVDVSQKIDHFKLDIDKISGSFTRGAIFRLFIPDLLPQLSKVIYLDTDIIVNMDIGELWDISLGAYPIAGVLDMSSINREYGKKFSTTRIAAQASGFIPGQYINSGVLLIDLDKIRKHGSLANLAYKFFLKHKNGLPDQDFLNMEFLHEIKIIDRCFNDEPKEAPVGTDLFGHIWHFGGFGGKPWKNCIDAEPEILYWQYLNKTPWKDELIGSMLTMAKDERFYHRHSEACVKRLKAQLFRNIQKANPIPIIINIIKTYYKYYFSQNVR